jgi:hypothetical protein
MFPHNIIWFFTAKKNIFLWKNFLQLKEKFSGNKILEKVVQYRSVRVVQYPSVGWFSLNR